MIHRPAETHEIEQSPPPMSYRIMLGGFAIALMPRIFRTIAAQSSDAHATHLMTTSPRHPGSKAIAAKIWSRCCVAVTLREIAHNSDGR